MKASRFFVGLIALVISLAACSQDALSPPELATQAEVQRLSGYAAEAHFYDFSDCAESGVWLFVSEVKDQGPPGKGELSPWLYLSVWQENYCEGDYSSSYFDGPLDSAAFEMDKNLSVATLNTTVELYDWQTDTTEAVTVDLTWHGEGDLVKESVHWRYKVGDLIVRERMNGTNREASAFGTVMLESTNLISRPSDYALLQQVKSGVVTVYKGGSRYPVIRDFYASPELISAGEAATLSWDVESKGKISLSIDPDVGDVSGLSSVQVSPDTTTTYRLSATNRQGSSEAWATVWVLADDEFEPNNTVAQASATELDFYSPELTLTTNDVDWFSFELAETSQLSVYLDSWFEPSWFEPYLGLFDSSGAELVNGNYLEAELGAGQYYLVVTGIEDTAFTGAHDQTGFYFLGISSY